MKTARLDIRLPALLKQQVEEAAALLGLSTTEFTTKALKEKTETVNQHHDLLVLANEDRDLLLAALDSPSEPVPQLREAFKWYEEINERKRTSGKPKGRKAKQGS